MKTSRPYVKGNDKLQWSPVYARVCTILLDAHDCGLIKLSDNEQTFVRRLYNHHEITDNDRRQLGKISWRTIEGRKYGRNSWWKGELLPKWEKKIKDYLSKQNEDDLEYRNSEACAMLEETRRGMEKGSTVETLSNEVLLEEYKRCRSIRPIRATNEFTTMLHAVVENLARHEKFSNYTFLPEMKENAMRHLRKNIWSFRPEISNNIFSYATQITSNAFVQILHEKRKETIEGGTKEYIDRYEDGANDIIARIRERQAEKRQDEKAAMVTLALKDAKEQIVQKSRLSQEEIDDGIIALQTHFDTPVEDDAYERAMGIIKK